MHNLNKFSPLYSTCFIFNLSSFIASSSQLNDLSSSKAAGSGFFTIVDDVSFAICQIDVLVDKLHSLIGNSRKSNHKAIMKLFGPSR